MSNKALAIANIASLSPSVLSPLIQKVKDTDSSLCQDHRMLSGSLEGYLSDVSGAYDAWRRGLEYENPLRWSYILGVFTDSVVVYGYDDDDDYTYASVAYAVTNGAIEFGEVTPVNVDVVVSTTGIAAQDTTVPVTDATDVPEVTDAQSVAEGDPVEVKGEGEAGEGGGDSEKVVDQITNPDPQLGSAQSEVPKFDKATFLKQSAFGKPEKLIQGSAYDYTNHCLCEVTQSETVEVNGKKHLKIQGTATIGDIVNANGYVYPTTIWQKNLPYLKAEAQGGKFYGKLEHPDEDLGLKDVAILFSDFDLQDAKLAFTGIVVPTEPDGANLQKLIEAGAKIDLSSRGYGSTKNQSWQGETRPVIQDDFVCTAFDAVWHGASTGSGIESAEFQSLKVELIPAPDLVQSKTEIKETIVDDLTTTTDTAPKVEATQAAAVITETPAQIEARQLQSAKELTDYRKNKVAAVQSTLSAEGITALTRALDSATTLDAVKQSCDTILPILQGTFPAPDTTAAAAVTQSVTFAPQFYVKQSAEELAPKNINELFDRLVRDLPDAYPGMEQTTKAPSHFQSPRQACKRIMINIAKESQGNFNGRAAAMALLALEQKRPEAAKDILFQDFSSDSTIANGNAENDGAPLSAPLIFPLVRRVYAMLILNRIAAIQPMDRPQGKIFYIDHFRTADPTEGNEKRIDLNTSANPFHPTYAVNNTEGSAAEIIRMRLNSITVEAETRKLGAQWSIEEMQDLRAYHNLDAAAELMGAVAKEMAQEINADVLNDMLAQATGGALTFNTGLPASGFTNQKDWDEYLWVYIQKLDNLIFGKRQAPMTHLVVGMDAALALAKSGRGVFTLGGDATGNMELYPGTTFYGRIASPTGSHYEVFKTNYWASGTTNGSKILGLRKGTEWSDTPYIYAPYTEYMTPQFTDPEDFSVKQGMMTRSAKQVVVSDAIAVLTVASGTGVPL